jgi:hypothetical protein
VIFGKQMLIKLVRQAECRSAKGKLMVTVTEVAGIAACECDFIRNGREEEITFLPNNLKPSFYFAMLVHFASLTISSLAL